MSDAHRRLMRALIARGGDGCRITAADQWAWASLLFEGTRHCLTISVPGEAAARFVDGIGEAEFTLPGHLVADIAVIDRVPQDGGMVAVRLEALTLVES